MDRSRDDGYLFSVSILLSFSAVLADCFQETMRQSWPPTDASGGRPGGRLPVIAVGGICSADDAARMFDAGASLVQLYTGLVYQGPALVRAIARLEPPGGAAAGGPAAGDPAAGDTAAGSAATRAAGRRGRGAW